MIQPNRVYKLTLKNGKEITGQVIGQKIHSKIFKDQLGKRIEIQNSDIESFEMIEDLTNKPYKHQDTDTKLKNRKGPMKSSYQTGEW